MAKTKSSKTSKVEEPKAITSVKGGSVVKSSQTPKSKSKEVAKSAADKASKVGKAAKKVVKEPTPSSDSDAETSDSSASSEDESEDEKPAAKTNGVAKTNGKVNGVSAKKAESSDEASESDSSESDEEPAKANGAAAAAAAADSDDSDDSDDSSSSEAEAKPKAKAGKAAAAAKADSDDDSEDDSEDSDSGSSDSDESEEEEKKPEPASKKRKAEAEATPVAKKVKSDVPEGASKNLFIGNLSWNVDEEWLKSEFEGFGTITGCRIVTDRDSGRSKGFGYVEFENIEDAAAAYNAKVGSSLDGRDINVDYSKPRPEAGDRAQRAERYGDQVGEPSDTLFVGNISFDATSDMIGEEFGKHADVSGVRLPTDPNSGNLKGFGYVQFASVEDAKAAMEAMKGAEIAGRVIRLDYSTPRADNGGSPRGGRGGRGGGGRGGGRGDFRGGRGGGRGGGGGRGRGDSRGGRGGSTNRGGFGDFKGKKMTF